MCVVVVVRNIQPPPPKDQGKKGLNYKTKLNFPQNKKSRKKENFFFCILAAHLLKGFLIIFLFFYNQNTTNLLFIQLTRRVSEYIFYIIDYHYSIFTPFCFCFQNITFESYQSIVGYKVTYNFLIKDSHIHINILYLFFDNPSTNPLQFKSINRSRRIPFIYNNHL